MSDTNSNEMPQIGGRLELTIDDVAFGGEGVGRVDGLAVFVPFTIPGELVEVEITELKKSYGRARLLNVLQAASERVEPEWATSETVVDANTSTSPTTRSLSSSASRLRICSDG